MVGPPPVMIGLVPRAQWGAELARHKENLVREQIRGLSFHYSGANEDEFHDHKFCASRVRAIQRFHIYTRKWADIAYSFVVCRHAGIFVGRGWRLRSAANGSNKGNDAFIAVCFLGDDSEGRADLTRGAKRGMERIIARFPTWHDFKPRLAPHSAFVGTECPGDEIRTWLQTVSKRYGHIYVPDYK